MALFIPARFYRRVEDITQNDLQQMGIQGVLLDVDNTLSPHGAPTPLPTALQWVYGLQAAGIKVLIVSNNKTERVAPFAAKFGLDFISKAAKPLPSGFRRGQDRLGLPREKLLVVGDQLFTDIWGAKNAGLRNILVKPINPKEEIQIVLKRYLEKIVLHFYTKEEKNS